MTESEVSTHTDDPNLHWDGTRWLRFDGAQWVDAQSGAPLPQAEPEPQPATAIEPVVLEQYKIVYRGGHPDYPKSKTAAIKLLITPESFLLMPTSTSQKWWQPLDIPYRDVLGFDITQRQVTTFEGIVGGLDSRQLNQANNIHIHFVTSNQQELILRFEMLSGVSVMGQAGKCRQLMDRLQTLGILQKFRQTGPAAAARDSGAEDPMVQLEKLGQLRDAGVLTEAEFDTKKADLLGRI